MQVESRASKPARAASARMVSMVGHLIGTPLNVIAGRASLIRTNPTPEGTPQEANPPCP